MDRLVPGAWLEKQLAAPDLRILDCTVSRVVLPQRRSRLPEWASSLVEGTSQAQDMLISLRSCPICRPVCHLCFPRPAAITDHARRDLVASLRACTWLCSVRTLWV